MPNNSKTVILKFDIDPEATSRLLVSQLGINNAKIYYQAMQDITGRLEMVCYEYFENEIVRFSSEYKVGKRMEQFMEANQKLLNSLSNQINGIDTSSHDSPDL